MKCKKNCLYCCYYLANMGGFGDIKVFLGNSGCSLLCVKLIYDIKLLLPIYYLCLDLIVQLHHCYVFTTKPREFTWGYHINIYCLLFTVHCLLLIDLIKICDTSITSHKQG